MRLFILFTLDIDMLLYLQMSCFVEVIAYSMPTFSEEDEEKHKETIIAFFSMMHKKHITWFMIVEVEISDYTN